MKLNRREFLLQAGAATAVGVATGSLARGASAAPTASGKGVVIISDPADPVAASKPARWATDQLRLALVARGFDARVVATLDAARPDDLCVVAAGRRVGLSAVSQPEALNIGNGQLGGRAVLFVSGSDARGLSYALTEIADRVALYPDAAAALNFSTPVTERPANAIFIAKNMLRK